MVGCVLAGCRQVGEVGTVASVSDSGANLDAVLVEPDSQANPDTAVSIEQLQAMCRDRAFQLASAGCIEFARFPEYSARCGSVNGLVLTQFLACSAAGGCPAASCLALLLPERTEVDVAECRSSCRVLLSFGCLSAADHTRCSLLCGDPSTTVAAATAFIDCANGLCSPPDCFAAFAESAE